jgi:HD-GYP domain-containing protein (c-di-GMP phosphodiesterase class II)
VARIVAVADAFDAMTSDRPYRPAMPPDAAFAELLRQAGTHFDPACVQAFLSLRAQVEQRLKQGRSVAHTGGRFLCQSVACW